MATNDVLAAGVVAFSPGKRVLLVHRPRYDDWSFPKGKLDRGEHVTAAAVREVAEETGLRVRLGPPLELQRYAISGGRRKSVRYWVARAVGSDDVSGYRPNAEIDEVRWVPYDEALELLTYKRDRVTLDEARLLRRRTHALVVLRHGEARARRTWRREDWLRPLVQEGRHQAQQLVPLLAAYGVGRVVSSSSMRCVETVAPYAEAFGGQLELDDGLSEEEATAGSVRRTVDGLVGADRSAVLCTHRPVLPLVFDALGLPDPQLEKGGLLVAHVRKGSIVATERHLVH